MDTILSLLRKIARLAAAPSAPEAERAAAAAKLRALMTRHNLTEADLTDDQPAWRNLIPQPACAHEMNLAVQIAGVIQGTSRISYRGTIKRGKVLQLIQFEATASQWAEILDCWQHHLPQFRSNWKQQVTREQKRLRKQLAELPKTATTAFFDKFGIYPPDDPDESNGTGRPPTLEELLSAMSVRKMAQDMTGEAWERKAGSLQSEKLRLA